MSELTCPHCKNLVIDDDALLCHFCGESLNRSSSGMLGKMRGGGNRWVPLVVAGLIVLSFILYLLR